MNPASPTASAHEPTSTGWRQAGTTVTESHITSTPLLEVVRDEGTGRPWLIVVEKGAPYRELADEAFALLREKGRALLFECPWIDDASWEGVQRKLDDALKDRSFRHGSILAFGGAGTIGQWLALHHPKLVRTLVLVDGATRSRASPFLRFIERVERALPLGLPLRGPSTHFDAKPFLQRIRRPVLVVLSHRADAYRRGEAALMAAELPTAWLVSLPHAGETGAAGEREAMRELLTGFLGVQMKRPQKTTARGRDGERSARED